MVILSDDLLGKWGEYTPPPVQSIDFGKGKPACSVLRLDLIRSWASGNKYFKLKYAVRHALEHGISTIVSKGGMFSNHLAALSDACSAFGIRLVAVIRSHGPDEANPCIRKLRSDGTEILYTTSANYKTFGLAESTVLYPEALFIPEGGLSEQGIQGTSEMTMECLLHQPTHVILAGGSMGTACGLLKCLPELVNVIIVPAWKGCDRPYVVEILSRYGINPSCSWELWTDYHFGGFGKFDEQLIAFMTSFSKASGIPLDPVYTGKMMYAVDQKVQQGYFKSSDHLLVIHSGGIQGLEGYGYRFPEVWGPYLKG